MKKEDIVSPTLIIDTNICRDNIRKMAEKAKKQDLIFRPHFKTHQDNKIAEIYREFGVNKITVSSVSMAEIFSNLGWSDISIAFPVNIREIDKINNLNSGINLNILVENIESVSFLSTTIQNKTGVFIKVDSGYHRTGIEIENIENILQLVSKIKESKNLVFKGFVTHAGHSYKSKTKPDVDRVQNQVISAYQSLRKFFTDDDLIYSSGDTPTCCLSDDFSGINEIRPGNFVYFDVMQVFIGSCSFENIAVSVACPVVAKHKQRSEVVIYVGAVHLSKESCVDRNGNIIFGVPVIYDDKLKHAAPLHGSYISSLSQEHGILKASKEYFDAIQIGDIIGVLPVHSCLTADLSKNKIYI